MTHVLIDTDVILDLFFDRKPYSENTAKVLSLCESKQITGYITPVILNNVYYLLRKNGQHEQVIEKLKNLMSLIEILIIDKQSIINALTSDFNDFEDALQNFAAEKNKEISLIITRNTKDYKNSSLGVMTPDSFLTFRNA